MEAFGIFGFVVGLSAIGIATNAMARISKLEKQLKENGVLDEGYKAE